VSTPSGKDIGWSPLLMDAVQNVIEVVGRARSDEVSFAKSSTAAARSEVRNLSSQDLRELRDTRGSGLDVEGVQGTGGTAVDGQMRSGNSNSNSGEVAVVFVPVKTTPGVNKRDTDGAGRTLSGRLSGRLGCV
jgi:hypothetical protein